MTSPGPAANDPQPTGFLMSEAVAEGPEMAKERVSTMLSTVAVLAITVGVTWGLWAHIGPWALCAGGLVLALMVQLADNARRASSGGADGLRAQSTAPNEPGPPGPTSPGNLHTKGPGAQR